MVMGIRHPGYQLLSLVPPSPDRGTPSFAHQPCLLPDQLGIYLNAYIPLLALTLITLSTFFGLSNPLNAMQILFINILMDGSWPTLAFYLTLLK